MATHMLCMLLFISVESLTLGFMTLKKWLHGRKKARRFAYDESKDYDEPIVKLKCSDIQLLIIVIIKDTELGVKDVDICFIPSHTHIYWSIYTYPVSTLLQNIIQTR